MAEYIKREAALSAQNKSMNLAEMRKRLERIPAADVVERKIGKNVATEYDDCDQFVCSECGIELQDWHRVERDEDDGDVTYHEYRFRICPNCGAKMIGGDEDEEPPKEELV